MSAPWPTLSAPPALDIAPWGWNPAATFQAAYNTQRIADEKAEEMQMANELERILLPAKIAEAEYATKKLAYDSKLLERIYRTQSAALDRSYQGVTSAVGGSGASSNVAGNVGSSNQAGAQDPTSFNLTGTVYDRKSAAQPQTGSQPVAKKKVDLTGI